jgi:hypothetical protein
MLLWRLTIVGFMLMVILPEMGKECGKRIKKKLPVMGRGVACTERAVRMGSKPEGMENLGKKHQTSSEKSPMMKINGCGVSFAQSVLRIRRAYRPTQPSISLERGGPTSAFTAP